MQSNDPEPVLRCPECGSRVFEIRGPVTDDATIRCAACGFACGQVPELMSELESRVRARKNDRRKRRLH